MEQLIALFVLLYPIENRIPPGMQKEVRTWAHRFACQLDLLPVYAIDDPSYFDYADVRWMWKEDPPSYHFRHMFSDVNLTRDCATWSQANTRDFNEWYKTLTEREMGRWAAYKKDIEWREEVWYEVYRIRHYNWDNPYNCRLSLKRLRELIGDEAFYSGQLPTPLNPMRWK